MKKFNPILLGLSLAVAGGSMAATQPMQAQTASIPRILQVTREYTKPYKNGMAHDRTEAAFVEAMAKAHWPTHYIGMTSLSGRSRALFFTFYDSLQAWQDDTAAIAKNPVLAGELERASVADGELLDEVTQGVFAFDEEMSLNAMADISHQRFLEISVYQVRPGRETQWSDAVKLVKAAYEKANVGAHWGMWREIYGGEGGRYIVLTSHKNLGEIDRDFLNGKQFADALGEDGQKNSTTWSTSPWNPPNTSSSSSIRT